MTALLGLDARMRLARLYVRSDGRDRPGDLDRFLTAVLRGGADLVEIRPSGMPPEHELAVLTGAREQAARLRAMLVVSSSVELAEKIQADVFQLDADSEPADRVRKHLHPWALVGRWAQSERQVRRALADTAVSYLQVGPVFGGGSAGLDLVRYAAKQAPPSDLDAKPWFAAGGVTADNLDRLLEAGARRVSVGAAVTAAADPQEAARALKRRLAEAWRNDPAMERYVFAAAASTGPAAWSSGLRDDTPEDG